jgi:broad specificity phosphatase PhoE
MGNLYLVRHGQASFGADDYDQLSELGTRQSVRLGQYLAGKGLSFEAAYTGTLKRHAQTLDGILSGMAEGSESSTANSAIGTIGARHVLPGLNEYDGEAVIRAIAPHPLERPTTPELYRAHFRMLRDGLTQWMNGVLSPQGMPTYDEFVAGVTGALDTIRKAHTGNVLMVSSGGPISTAVGHLLGTSPETTIELNYRIRNSALTEFVFTPKRHTLLTYNTLPHLDEAQYEAWMTYA